MPGMRRHLGLAALALAAAAAGAVLARTPWTAVDAGALRAAPSGDELRARVGGPKPTPAATGRRIDGELPAGRGAAKLYLFQVPEDAVQVDVSLDGAGRDRDVEFRAASGADVPERDGDWTWQSAQDGGPAKLSLTRYADDELRPGPLLVEVRSAEGATRRGRGSLPFALSLDVTWLAAPRRVAPGASFDAETAPEAGHRADFVVDVPAGAKALRIDLVEAERDLDLLASARAPALDRDAAEWRAASPLARESLVLDPGSEPRFVAGRTLYFSVIDPSLYDAPVRFRAAVTLAADPPPEALALPELPQPQDPRERAVAAVVEIVVEDGSGSGTLVRDDGLVLTARHVIGDHTGEAGDITVAIDLDPTQMTKDLFHAKVVAIDEGLDVALLQITSGLYGQALPRGYRFPACPVAFGAPLRLGDPLYTVGFAEPGGTGSRSPVLFSQGVVAGFERQRSGTRVKTDAVVASGSSGGAALDASYRLAGVPVFIVNETEGTAQMGFLVAVGELPAEWQQRIRR